MQTLEERVPLLAGVGTTTCTTSPSSRHHRQDTQHRMRVAAKPRLRGKVKPCGQGASRRAI